MQQEKMPMSFGNCKNNYAVNESHTITIGEVSSNVVVPESHTITIGNASSNVVVPGKLSFASYFNGSTPTQIGFQLVNIVGFNSNVEVNRGNMYPILLDTLLYSSYTITNNVVAQTTGAIAHTISQIIGGWVINFIPGNTDLNKANINMIATSTGFNIANNSTENDTGSNWTATMLIVVVH